MNSNFKTFGGPKPNNAFQTYAEMLVQTANEPVWEIVTFHKDSFFMRLEGRARQSIDARLEQAGWVIQDLNSINPTDSLGVAVREFPTAIEGDFTENIVFFVSI